VVGAPGIGKTRLGLELAGLVAQQGGRVLRGRSLPYGERTAYWVFAQIVRDACGVFASDTAAIARAKVDDRVDQLLAEDDAAKVATDLSILARLTEDTVEDREELFSSARRFVEALANEQPTLLVLEDLHWADGGCSCWVAGRAAGVRRCSCSRSRETRFWRMASRGAHRETSRSSSTPSTVPKRATSYGGCSRARTTARRS
jgi:hypothetical protein